MALVPWGISITEGRQVRSWGRVVLCEKMAMMAGQPPSAHQSIHRRTSLCERMTIVLASGHAAAHSFSQVGMARLGTMTESGRARGASPFVHRLARQATPRRLTQRGRGFCCTFSGKLGSSRCAQ